MTAVPGTEDGTRDVAGDGRTRSRGSRADPAIGHGSAQPAHAGQHPLADFRRVGTGAGMGGGAVGQLEGDEGVVAVEVDRAHDGGDAVLAQDHLLGTDDHVRGAEVGVGPGDRHRTQGGVDAQGG